MKEISKLRFSRLNELKINIDDSALDSFKGTNLFGAFLLQTIVTIVLKCYKIYWKFHITLCVKYLLFIDEDLEHLLHSAMPSCKQLFINCSWKYNKINCCDVFETQKTIFGFCYAFNSLTSYKRENKNENLLKANNYGIRGGLVFTVNYNNINFPPDVEGNKIHILSSFHMQMDK